MFKIILVFTLSVLGTEIIIMELLLSCVKTFINVIITILLSLRLGVVLGAVVALFIFAVTGEANAAATLASYEASNNQLSKIGYAIICVSFSVLALVLKKTK